MTSQQDNLLYRFGPFKLDPAERQLWQDDQKLDLAPREFDTLCYLVNNHGRLFQKDHLMSAIWPDSFVEESNLNLIVSNLRKTLGDNATNPSFIETVRKQGFRFIAAVEIQEKVGAETGKFDNVLVVPSIMSNGFANGRESNLGEEPFPTEDRAKRSVFNRYPRALIGLTVGILTLATVSFVLIERRHTKSLTSSEISSPFDEAEVRRVVKESQMYETLSVYTDPASFDEKRLSDYWVSEDQGGKEIKNVKNSVQRLLSKKWHYDKSSKAEVFEFRYSKIFAPGDYGEVGTIERWYLPTMNQDGTRVLDKNVFLGPMNIDYKLRKVNGKWLIEETTIPRPH